MSTVPESETPVVPKPAEKVKAPGVTVLSGFLGSGKTTLLKRLLEHAATSGTRLGVIVNDMASLNVDADIVRKATRGQGVKQAEYKLVQLENGCICCTLREDLLIEIKRLVAEQQLDYIVIESTGVSEPLPVAETFTFAPLDDEAEHSHDITADHAIEVLGDVARLDCMVTMVDVVSFAANLFSVETLAERYGRDEVEEEDNRTLASLLIDQLEFANVIVLNKVSSFPSSGFDGGNVKGKPLTMDMVRGIVQRINPDARLLETDYSAIDAAEVLNTGLFDFEQAMLSPGWLKEARGEHMPETEEYGISSFVWRSRRPLHPQRTNNLLGPGSAALRQTGLVRAKGVTWFANAHDVSFYVQGSGEMWNVEPSDPWEATLPPEERFYIDQPAEVKQRFMDEDWLEPYGDRRQELVMIGQFSDGDRDTVRRMFGEALVTDEEFEAGPGAWANFEDALNFKDMFAGDDDDIDDDDDDSKDDKEAEAEGKHANDTTANDMKSEQPSLKRIRKETV